MSVVLASVVSAEVLYRGILWLRGDPYSAAGTELTMRTIADFATQDLELTQSEQAGLAREGARKFEVLHPFLGFDSGSSHKRVNQDVRRSRTRSANDFHILLLGGSVATMFGRDGTAVLAQRLRADPRFAGKHISFLNHARLAFKQPQQTMMLAYLLALGLEPDAVINIDGFNEVAMGNANVEHGVNPVYPHFRQWLPKATLGPSGIAGFESAMRLVARRESLADAAAGALGSGWYRSALLGRWQLAGLQRQHAELTAASDVYIAALGDRTTTPALYGPAFAGAAVKTCVDIWANSSRSIDGMCKARSIFYLHVLQPTLHDRGSKKLTPLEIKRGKLDSSWIVGVRRGYSRLRQTGARLRERGVHLFDASGVFRDVEQTVYGDGCHFGENGNHILARAIAVAFLREYPRAQPPREKR